MEITLLVNKQKGCAQNSNNSLAVVCTVTAKLRTVVGVDEKIHEWQKYVSCNEMKTLSNAEGVSLRD